MIEMISLPGFPAFYIVDGLKMTDTDTQAKSVPNLEQGLARIND